jgi:hypothetical protein
MHTSFVTLALATSVLGAQFHSNVKYDFGAMLKRGEVIAKRQGYYPTTEPCGEGDTCAEACGATQIQCPSSYGMYCYEPSLSHCCNDLTGYACDDGYYCTTDGADNTYCCPDGMDTVDCAAAYSLTVSLIRETATALPPTDTVLPSTETAVEIPVSTSKPIHITYGTATSTAYPTANGTYTTATATSPPEFTGAAARVAGAGMAVLAGAAGLFL